MQADIEIHKAAMSLTPHRPLVLRRGSEVGVGVERVGERLKLEQVAAGVRLDWSWIAATVDLLRLM